MSCSKPKMSPRKVFSPKLPRWFFAIFLSLRHLLFLFWYEFGHTLCSWTVDNGIPCQHNFYYLQLFSYLFFFWGFFFSKGEHLSRLVDFIGCYLPFPCPQGLLPELLQKRDPIPVDLHSDLRASSGAVVAAALTSSKVLECYSQSWPKE